MVSVPVARRLWTLVAVGLLSTPTPALASSQGAWDADLSIDPFPSPYVSDWEANPDIGVLTVFNNTGAEATVRLTFSLTGASGGVIAHGSSDPLALAPGPTHFDSPFDLSGTFDYDVSIQDAIVRAGRLPEGDFTACTVASDRSGFVLAQACAPFSVLYPDPPMLISPYDGERIAEQDPFFAWTPLQVPAEYPIHFVLQIAQVLPGQTAGQALGASIPHYVNPNLPLTTFQYPLGALPFEPGVRYAWRVQAIDGNGYAASANDGSSEIWTFTYGDGGDGIASLRVSPSADTLSFVGDSTRLIAQAFDALGFELPDPEIEWRSADTLAARVDSAGIVTSAAAGEARIIATVDGIADTVTILTGTGDSRMRIAFYDPASEQPELFGLLQSGTYEEVASRLQDLLQRGEFVLPLPGIPVVEDRAAPGGGGGTAGCPEITLPYYARFDPQRKSLAIGMRPPIDVAGSLFECLGIADWWTERPGQKLELLFAVALPEQGAAQATLGMKLPFIGIFEDQPRIHFDYAVLVLNFWRGFEMDAASTLPANSPEIAAFYPHKFKLVGLDVERSLKIGEKVESETETTGIGALNLYMRLDLSRTGMVGLLDALGYQEPVIELQGALSLSKDGGLLPVLREAVAGSANADTAKGGRKLHLEGRLPKRVPQAGNLSDVIHWAQAGIELEIESEWNRAGAADSSKTTVTPKLTHTLELQLPFDNWPVLELKGSLAWAGIEQSSATGAADGDTTTSSRSKWTIAYEVGTGGESTLVLWNFLHLKAGAEIGYTRSTAAAPAEWELKLSGTTGFGSAEEAAKVSVAYVRESVNCGDTNEPRCTQPPDQPGRPQAPELGKKQNAGQWVFTLESKGVALGAILKDVMRLVRELRQ